MASSLKEIARLAGTSEATVSLVINGRAAQYRISQATQKKVLALAEQFNFLPNEVARGLVRRESRALGLVLPRLSVPLYAEIAEHFTDIAFSEGYQVFISSSHSDYEREHSAIQRLMAYKVRGIVVATVLNHARLVEHLSGQGLPVVFIDRRIRNENISYVESDNRQGAYEVVQHLIAQGHREIAYLGAYRHNSPNVGRFEGYCAALKDAGLPFDSALVEQGEDYPVNAVQLTATLMARLGRLPEAMIAATTANLLGLLGYLKQQLGHIPPELKLGAFAEHPVLDLLPMQVPHVRQDARGMARAAYELVMAQDGDGAWQAQQRVVPALRHLPHLR